MTVDDKTTNEIAALVTGWVVTDAEAKSAFSQLMNLNEATFIEVPVHALRGMTP